MNPALMGIAVQMNAITILVLRDNVWMTEIPLNNPLPNILF